MNFCNSRTNLRGLWVRMPRGLSDRGTKPDHDEPDGGDAGMPFGDLAIAVRARILS